MRGLPVVLKYFVAAKWIFIFPTMSNQIEVAIYPLGSNFHHDHDSFLCVISI